MAIMAHHSIALYVGKQPTFIVYMHVLFYLFCIHYPYFICFIAVILNTLYAFYAICLVALHLFVEK